MSKKSLVSLVSAALLCCGLPAWAQKSSSADKGKELVDAHCNSCHALTARTGSGYDAKGWRTVMHMMTNQGVALAKNEIAPMTAYLVKAYPEKGRPAAAVVKGPLKVSMKIWKAPTPGSRPHDPLAARDGSLWYTGQMANVLGRVDPKTGKVREYPLKTAHSGPHGLMEDMDGNIWYTGNTGALIGKLDPKTGTVAEYPMPDPEAKDPHTLIFDKTGILWFTVQNANRIGRLDPKTGEIKLLTPPTPKSRPYGMALDSKGTVFVVQFGTNSVAAVDPATLQIKEYKLPDPGARPRRIAITSDRLVHRLRARLPGPPGSRDRQSHRVAIAERAEVSALRHIVDPRRHLVQRVRGQAEHRRALRSQDPEVPELDDPGRRQHRAQHLGHERGQLRAGQQPGEYRDAGQNPEVGQDPTRCACGSCLCAMERTQAPLIAQLKTCGGENPPRSF